jgi:hypothetical protein
VESASPPRYCHPFGCVTGLAEQLTPTFRRAVNLLETDYHHVFDVPAIACVQGVCKRARPGALAAGQPRCGRPGGLKRAVVNVQRPPHPADCAPESFSRRRVTGQPVADASEVLYFNRPRIVNGFLVRTVLALKSDGIVLAMFLRAIAT